MSSSSPLSVGIREGRSPSGCLCCTKKTSATIVAGILITTCLGFVVYFVSVLIALSGDSTVGGAPGANSKNPDAKLELDSKAFETQMLMKGYGILLGITCVSLLMHVILVVGIAKESRLLLLIWIVINALDLLVTLARGVYEAVETSEGWVWGILGSILLLKMIFIATVISYSNELRDFKGPSGLPYKMMN